MSPTPLDPVSGSPIEKMSRSLKQTQEDRPGRGNTRYKASRQEGRRGKTCDSTSISLISCGSLRTCSNTVICKVTQQEALPSLVRSLGRRELRAVGTRGAATAPGGHVVPESCTLSPGPAHTYLPSSKEEGTRVRVASTSASSTSLRQLHRRRSAKTHSHTDYYHTETNKETELNETDGQSESLSSCFRQLRHYPILTTVFVSQTLEGQGGPADGHLSWGDAASKPGASSPFCCAGLVASTTGTPNPCSGSRALRGSA